MTSQASSRISPTAHYTAQIWYRHGLSHEALTTRMGAFFYLLAQPSARLYERFGHGSLEGSLVARHLAIDALLTRAIESGEIGQVVEVACGLSPRGMRMARRHGDAGLVYVESDLPALAARKRRALDEAGLRGPNHHVVAVNALADAGPDSLAAATAPYLDPDRGTALVTEGLLLYFPEQAQQAMYQRFARFLRAFPRGLYLSDCYLGRMLDGSPATRLVKTMFTRITRNGLYLPFHGERDARAALMRAGFADATLHHPADLDLPLARADLAGRAVPHIIEARTVC